MGNGFLFEFYNDLVEVDNTLPDYEVFKSRIEQSIREKDGWLDTFHEDLLKLELGIPKDPKVFRGKFEEYFSEPVTETATEPVSDTPNKPALAPINNDYIPQTNYSFGELPKVEFNQRLLEDREFSSQIKNKVELIGDESIGIFGNTEESRNQSQLYTHLGLEALEWNLALGDGDWSETVRKFYGIPEQFDGTVKAKLTDGSLAEIGRVPEDVSESYKWLRLNKGKLAALREEDSRSMAEVRGAGAVDQPFIQVSREVGEASEFENFSSEYRQHQTKVRNWINNLGYQFNKEENRKDLTEVLAQGSTTTDYFPSIDVTLEQAPEAVLNQVGDVIGGIDESNRAKAAMLAMAIQYNPDLVAEQRSRAERALATRDMPISAEVDENELEALTGRNVLDAAGRWYLQQLERDAAVISARATKRQGDIDKLNGEHDKLAGLTKKVNGEEVPLVEYFQQKEEEILARGQELGVTVNDAGQLVIPSSTPEIEAYLKDINKLYSEVEEYAKTGADFNALYSDLAGSLGWESGMDELAESATSSISSPEPFSRLIKQLGSGAVHIGATATAMYAQIYNPNSEKFFSLMQQAQDISEVSHRLAEEAGFQGLGELKKTLSNDSLSVSERAAAISDYGVGITVGMIPVVASFIGAGYLGAKTGGAIFGTPAGAFILSGLATNTLGTTLYGGGMALTADTDDLNIMEMRDIALQIGLAGSLASTVVPNYLGFTLARVRGKTWMTNTTMDYLAAAGISSVAEGIGERIAQITTIIGEEALGKEISDEEKRLRIQEGTIAGSVMGGLMGPAMVGQHKGSLRSLVEKVIDGIASNEFGDALKTRAMSEKLLNILRAQQKEGGLSADGEAVLGYLETSLVSGKSGKVDSKAMNRAEAILADKAGGVFGRDVEANKARVIELGEALDNGNLTFEDAAELLALWATDSKAVGEALSRHSMRSIYGRQEAATWKAGDWISIMDGPSNMQGKQFIITGIDAKTGNMTLSDLDGNDLGQFTPKDVGRGYKIADKDIEAIKRRREEGDLEFRTPEAEVVAEEAAPATEDAVSTEEVTPIQETVEEAQVTQERAVEDTAGSEAGATQERVETTAAPPKAPPKAPAETTEVPTETPSASAIVTREQGGKTHEYQKQEDGTWVNVKYPDRAVKSEKIINELEQGLKAPKEVSSPVTSPPTSGRDAALATVKEKFANKAEKDIFVFEGVEGATTVGFRPAENPRNIKAHPNLFSHKEASGYVVSDKKTGIRLASGSTIKGAIDKAVSAINKASKEGETQRETLDRLTASFIDSLLDRYYAADNKALVEAVDTFLGSPAVASQTEQTTDEAVAQTTTEETAEAEVAEQKQTETTQVQPPKEAAVVKKETPKQRSKKRESAGLPVTPKTTSDKIAVGDKVTFPGITGTWEVTKESGDGYSLRRLDGPGLMGGVSASDIKKVKEAPVKSPFKGRYGRGSAGLRKAVGRRLSMKELAELKRQLPSVFNVLRRALSKVAPNTMFLTHDTVESYLSALPESDRARATGSNAYYSDGTVHLLWNDNLQFNSPFHEAVHAVLNAIKAENPALYTEIIEGAFSRLEQAGEEGYISFGELYDGEFTKKEEAVVEWLSDVALNRYNKGQKTWVSRLLTWLKNKIFGPNKYVINSDLDIVGMARGMANALGRGDVLLLGSGVKSYEVTGGTVKGPQVEPQFQKQTPEQQRFDQAKEAVKGAEALEGFSNYPSPTDVAFYLAGAVKSGNLSAEDVGIAQEYIDAYLEMPPPKFQDAEEFMKDAIVAGASWSDIDPFSKTADPGAVKVARDLGLAHGKPAFELLLQLHTGGEYASAFSRLLGLTKKVAEKIGDGYTDELRKGVENLETSALAAYEMISQIFVDNGRDVVAGVEEAYKITKAAWAEAGNRTALIPGGMNHYLFEELIARIEIEKGVGHDKATMDKLLALQGSILETMVRLEVHGGRYNSAIQAGSLDVGSLTMGAVHEMLRRHREWGDRVITVEDKDGNRLERRAGEVIEGEVEALRAEVLKTFEEKQIIEGSLKEAMALVEKLKAVKTPKAAKVKVPQAARIKEGKRLVKEGISDLGKALRGAAGSGPVLNSAVGSAIVKIVKGAILVAGGNIQKAIASTKQDIADFEVDGKPIGEKVANEWIDKVVTENEAELREVMIDQLADRLKKASGSSDRAIKSVVSRMFAALSGTAKTNKEKIALLLSNEDAFNEIASKVRSGIHSDPTLTEAEKSERIRRLNELVREGILNNQAFTRLIEGAARKEAASMTDGTFAEALREIVSDFYTEADKSAQFTNDLAARIVGELDVTAEQAEQIAAVIQDYVKGKLKASADRWVASISKPKAPARARKTKLDKLVEFITKTGLAGDQMKALFREKYDLPILTDAEIRQLKAKARQVFISPEGIRRNQAKKELASYLFNLRDRTFMESFVSIYRDIYYVSILSGIVTTGMRNFFGPVLASIGNAFIPDMITSPLKFSRFWLKVATDPNFLKLAVGSGLAVTKDVMVKGYSDQLYAETPLEDARHLDTIVNNMGKHMKAAAKGSVRDGVKVATGFSFGAAVYAVRSMMLMDNLMTPFMVEYEAYMSAYDQAKKLQEGKIRQWVPMGKEFNHQLDEILAINRMEDFANIIDSEVDYKVADGSLRDLGISKSRYRTMRFKEEVLKARDEDTRAATERSARTYTLLNSPHGILPALLYRTYLKATKGFGHNNWLQSFGTFFINQALLANFPIVRVPLNMGTMMYHWSPLAGVEYATQYLADRTTGSSYYGHWITDMGPNFKPKLQKMEPHMMARRWAQTLLGTVFYLLVQQLMWEEEEAVIDTGLGPQTITRVVPKNDGFRVTGGKYIGPVEPEGFAYNAVQIKVGDNWKSYSYQDSPFLMFLFHEVGEMFNDYYVAGEAMEVDPNVPHRLIMRAFGGALAAVTRQPDFTFNEPLARLLTMINLSNRGRSRTGQTGNLEEELTSGFEKAMVLFGGVEGNPYRGFATPLPFNQNAYKQGMRLWWAFSERPMQEGDTYVGKALANTPIGYLMEETVGWPFNSETIEVKFGSRKESVLIPQNTRLDYFGRPLVMPLSAPYSVPFPGLGTVTDDFVSQAEFLRAKSASDRLLLDENFNASLLPRSYVPPANLPTDGSFWGDIKAFRRREGMPLTLSNQERLLINQVYKVYLHALLERGIAGRDNYPTLRNWESLSNRVAAGELDRDEVVAKLKKEIRSVHNEAAEEAREHYFRELTGK